MYLNVQKKAKKKMQKVAKPLIINKKVPKYEKCTKKYKKK